MAQADEPPLDPKSQDDVLGQLDQLLHRHRPKRLEPESPLVPVLTDALAAEQNPIPENIPTLLDVVSGPGNRASAANPEVRPDPAVTLEARLVLQLTARLEAEHTRLLAHAGSDPARIRTVEELISRLKRSLPEIVRAALSDAPSRSK